MDKAYSHYSPEEGGAEAGSQREQHDSWEKLKPVSRSSGPPQTQAASAGWPAADLSGSEKALLPLMADGSRAFSVRFLE